VFKLQFRANHLQMPLVDGILSTKMIRRLEKELEESLKTRPRVPILAVSSSLTEDNRFDYLQSGYATSQRTWS
jgi:hypothetical protein